MGPSRTERRNLMAQVDEVAPGIYRISTLNEETQFQFNQFLIDGERPALIHTGMFPMYEGVRKPWQRFLTQHAWPTSFVPTSSPTSVVAWDASSRKHPRRCWPAAKRGRS